MASVHDDGGERVIGPAVAIIILNWNQGPMTLECLATVAQLEYPNRRVIVVDNGSGDDSVALVRAHYPDVDVVALDANLGYAEGNNRGIEWALRSDADYVLILNNDTFVAPDMLTELVRFAEGRPCLAIAGPLMYCVEPPDALFSAGGAIDWSRGVTANRGMFEAAAGDYQSRPPERVDYIAGCALLVSRRFIEQAGGFDPDYYLNYEDVEWSVRARQLGFEVWHVPQAVMWHRISASFGLGSPANTYYMTRNALRFFATKAPLPARPLAVSSIVFRTLRTVGAWSAKAEYRSESFRRRRDANLLALRDFLLGRCGAMGPDVAGVCYGAVRQ